MNTQTNIQARKTRELSKPAKHAFMLTVPLILLIIIGFTGVSSGWITTSKSSTDATAQAAGSVDDFQIPEAKVGDFSKDKYANSSMSEVQSGTGISMMSANQNEAMLTAGEQGKGGFKENSIEEAEAYAKSVGATQTGFTSNEDLKTPRERKIETYQQQRHNYGASQRNLNKTIKEMYSGEYSPDQKQAMALERAEAAQRLKANERLMEMLETQTQASKISVLPTSGSTEMDGDNPSFTTRMPKTMSQPVNPRPVAILEKNTRSVIRPSEGGNAFFGLNGKNLRNKSTRRGGAIRAVVHGDGDGIVITSGTTVAVRMLDETRLNAGDDQPLVLAPNTLIYAQAGFSGDRITLIFSSIRVGTQIYNVDLTAYDIDGRVGLYVPDLQVKSQVSQSLAQGGQQVAMPLIVNSQGSVGQQVGGQIAMQGVNQAMNVGRNILQRKVTQPRATVRPNYQILLQARASQSDNQNETETDK